MNIPSLDELRQDPYKALGVRKFINATCHHTMLGGTLLPEVSVDVMRAAAASHVNMLDLQRAAGRVISHYTHAEDGYIVSGCAAAMLVGTAAILTGKDPVKMQQLPDLTGMKSLCIAKRFPRRKNNNGAEYVDHGYAMAVKTAGVNFVEVGDGRLVTVDQYRGAFKPDVALVYWMAYGPKGDISVQDVIDIAHEHEVPVLIDCSNFLPPKENLHRFIGMGADLVAFSGGKGLQGPQGAGILAGRADLIESVAMQAAPSHGIGRVCKVSKEEVAAQIASLIWWVEQDDEDRLTEHRRKSEMLYELASDLPGAEAEVALEDSNQRPFPAVHLRALPQSGMNAVDVLRALRSGDPAIAAMTHPDPSTIRLDVRLCEDREIEAIGKRLREIFGAV